MTASSFASLGSGAFAGLAKARQTVVELRKAHDVACDACTCTGRGRCTCAADEHAVWKRLEDAQADLAWRERSWREYQSIRYDR